MSITIIDWLRGLGLERYAAAFRDNDIDDAVLRRLTAEDLRELGIFSVGHRRRLLDAIAALGAPAPMADVPGPPAGTAAPLAPRSDAERRQLTVMFCDLVGSTALSARLDPEDLREVIAAYHRAVAETVARFEGFVAKYMGDGVLVYFGYPRAHEEDAERAVRAGLGIIDAVGRLEAKSGKLQARIGIATGLVVVGDLLGSGAAQEQAVVGETPNLAARLQSLADPGTVLVDARTHRLVGNLFEQRSLGPVEIKGFARRQRVWQILGRSHVLSRFEALRSRATPLVGREEDIELLRRRWRQAVTGEGQVVLISGEAGIGKSRLAAALLEELASMPHTRLRYFCSPHHTDSALYPIIAQLEHAAGFALDEPPPSKLDKLDALLEPVATPAEDRALIAELLSLDGTDRRYPALDLTPQMRKERTLAALLRQLEALAQRQPVLMLFEDVHWIDPTSLELLDRTVECVCTLPVLLLVTFRPGFTASWIGQPHVTALVLRRLGMRDSAALAGHVSGNHALAAELLDEIVGRADGVPLFLEELTKAIVAVGPGDDEEVVAAVPSTSAAIPATLQASLVARLDRLGSAKEIAQIGAVIGREFSYELLRDLTALTETRLAAALAQLVASELVSRRGVPPMASYLFKHALVQEAAYETLLRTERRRLHARIADLLEPRAELVERQPELLAQHYAEAGLVEKAVAYWGKAGQRSAARSAMAEAAAQFQKGLGQLALLPDSRERKQQELDLQVALAGALLGMKGYAHSEPLEVLNRARDLVVETDAEGTTTHFSVLYGLFLANRAGGMAKPALERAREFLSLAQSRTDTGLLLMGHRLTGVSLIDTGDFPLALSHLERAVALYMPEAHRSLATWFGGDIGVIALAQWARALWHRGHSDQASKTADAALRHARRFVHPLTLVHTLLHVVLKLVSSRQAQEADECAKELIAISGEHRFAAYFGWGLILQGWALALDGQSRAAVGRIRNALATTRATGARWGEPLFLGLLAEALALAGALEEGLGVLAEALAIAEASGAIGNDAELHRLRGDLLQRMPSPDWVAIEASFHMSLAVARTQGTRGLEPRAAASLARLWRDQGRRDEARDLLAPVYGWFTEGFDTPDLKQAKALRDELA